MDIEINNKLWKNIFSVIQHSYKIETHLDFFKWVQNNVAAVIPHDVLVAAWGDFSDKNTGERLNYDVASNVEGINTRALWTALGEVGICAAHLH
ncbi:MAG: helix-turn-helix transcriptional regulator, partial [Methylotenera sp.]|nr:helix-turn-helix transcriptional regulator [Methylotenera sp.]